MSSRTSAGYDRWSREKATASSPRSPRASDALAAAVDAQRRFLGEPWPEGADLHVRMAIHTGEAQLRDEGNYFGQTVIRCARLRGIGHGDQVLLSDADCRAGRRSVAGGSEHSPISGLHRLKDLGRPERVWQVVHPDLPSNHPALRSLDAHRHNLPVQLTPLIGREDDVAALRVLLGEERLVTLTGSGGVGKTRLALAVAAEVLDRFSGGVWFVELAGVADGAAVGSAVLAAVGGHQAPGLSPVEQLIATLPDDPTLLVLDNCEHLVEPCAAFVAALLSQHVAVRVLATSRESLAVSGEVTWRVRSLSTPPVETSLAVPSLSQYEAVRLFIDRARRARPTFVVSEAERARHRPDLPSARRHPARPGAGGGSLPADVGRADRRRARRSLPPPHGRCADGASPPADAGCVGRLEP